MTGVTNGGKLMTQAQRITQQLELSLFCCFLNGKQIKEKIFKKRGMRGATSRAHKKLIQITRNATREQTKDRASQSVDKQSMNETVLRYLECGACARWQSRDL